MLQRPSRGAVWGTKSQPVAQALLVTCWRQFAVSQLRYRLQLCASTRRFHSNSYHTFYGHHPGLCNCPVSSWPFATGGISVEISATLTTCLREAFRSKPYHTFYGHHPGLCNCPVSSWPFATGGISVEISATTTCLREAFQSLKTISHFLRAPPRTVQLPCQQLALCHRGYLS